MMSIPAVAPDRGGMTVFQGSTSHQPPRQVNFTVLRETFWMPALAKPATLGACLHQLSAGSFLLTETMHPPGRKLARHRHARANLVVVLQGHFTETCAGGSFECGPHSVLLKPPGEPHSNVYG